ncbi:MAG: hypothetical protein ACI9S9_005029 [Planctomycetota bacterium]
MIRTARASESWLNPAPPRTVIAQMSDRIDRFWLATTAIAGTLLAACATPMVNDTQAPEAAKTTVTVCYAASPYPAFVQNQASDGSYSDNVGSESKGSNGARKPDITVTCLVTLALLGDGSTMRAGPERAQIKNAMRWLRNTQRPNGTVGAPGNMLEHGLATYTLVEGAGLSNYSLMWDHANPAMKALLAHRNEDGGWSSDPNQDHSDAEATAWCTLACMSARFFEHAAPKQPSDEDLLTWFDHHPATTAEHAACELLCRAIAGQTAPALANRVRAEASIEDPDECFWATSALFLLEGPNWEEWRLKMKGLESKMNRDKGHKYFGCYPATGRRGAISTTALVSLALEPFYRYSRLMRFDS